MATQGPDRTASEPRDHPGRRSRARDLPALGRRGRRAPPVQPQGAAGEPAAHRGRRQRHRRPRPRAGRLGPAAEPDTEIQFTPARVIMQDFTGVPCVVDLATMREAVTELGGDPAKVNPLAPAELVIDHSVIIDVFGTADAFERNVDFEYGRNKERYQFLRWGQGAFDEFKVVPPGTGIVHQVNIEHLARVVMTRNGQAYPDTLVGTDSHTTMVNGLGVLGWGVGGIEAEAAMLGQPVSMLIPKVVGFKLTGEIPAGATATDVVLTITEMLRQQGVVGKFVEFYGEGVGAVPLANRATIGNMSPEFGSTAAIFPIDDETIRYLKLTGRSGRAARARRGLRQGAGPLARPEPRAGLLRDPRARPRHGRPVDRRAEAPAGPHRADRRQVGVPQVGARLHRRPRGRPASASTSRTRSPSRPATRPRPGSGADEQAGAVLRGRRRRGPPVQADDGPLGVARRVRARPRRRRHRLDHQLHQHVQPVGHARRGAAGEERRREGPHREAVGQDVDGAGQQGRHRLLREGRPLAVPGEAGLPPGRLRLHHVHRQLRPALGRDLGRDQRGRPERRLGAVGQPQLRGPDQPRHQDELPGLAAAGHRLRPRRHDGLRLRAPAARAGHRGQRRVPEATSGPRPRTSRTRSTTRSARRCSPRTTPTSSRATSAGRASPRPRATPSSGTSSPPTSASPRTSTAWRRSPRRSRTSPGPGCWPCWATRSPPTTSPPPARSSRAPRPAEYLTEHGVEKKDFNSYGSRRGNHEVMIRGTFANIRLRNQLLDDVSGGYTRDFTQDDAPQAFIYDAAQNYADAGHPAGRAGRQGVRLRLLARLGGQGHRAARRQGRDRGVLRAHPPLEPDRHGRASRCSSRRASRRSRCTSTAPRPSTSRASPR